jgi:hypothetical protein
VSYKISNARRGLQFREAFLAGVTLEDLTAIATALVDRAKAGDLGAARLLLERLVGIEELRRWPGEVDVKQAEELARLME